MLTYIQQYWQLYAIVFGGIAGFIPAKKASNIKPIEALNDK